MTATPESLRQRYSEIELAYGERRWPEVESLSHQLLIDLPDEPSHPLRQRVVLLLGHTRLYGMGDVPAARRHYEALLRNGLDSTLREIAEQGLRQCVEVARQQDNASSVVAPPAGEADGQSAQGSNAAMPWMQAVDAANQNSGSQPGFMAVDVVEEPDQIEVAMADPDRQEELQLKELGTTEDHDDLLKPLGSRTPEEDQDLSRGLLRVVLR